MQKNCYFFLSISNIFLTLCTGLQEFIKRNFVIPILVCIFQDFIHFSICELVTRQLQNLSQLILVQVATVIRIILFKQCRQFSDADGENERKFEINFKILNKYIYIYGACSPRQSCYPGICPHKQN